MIDDRIVLQMASAYGMNPDKARKLLEDARSEPAIVRLIRRYEQLGGDNVGGSQGNPKASGQLQETEKGASSS